MDAKQESAELVQELEKLERERVEIEERKNKKLKEGEALVLNFLAALHLLDPGDLVLKDLQRSILETKKNIIEDQRNWSQAYNLVIRKLSALTGPAIAEGVRLLQHELTHAPKVIKETLGRDSGGFSMSSKVTIRSNEKGIVELQNRVHEAESTLLQMRTRSIEEIEDFIAETLRDLKKIDLSKVETYRVDEFENASREWRTKPI
jgi:hypothetical protein